MREATAIDLTQQPDFRSYLKPNERAPINMLRHLEEMDQELIVAKAGTERGLFTLLLSHASRNVLEFLITKVKAYNDLNILLLRIAKNRKEYLRLSTPSFIRTDETSTNGYKQNEYQRFNA